MKSIAAGRLPIGLRDPETDPQFDSAALVIIDTQQDVLDDGALTIAGTSAAVPAMGHVLQAFREAERPIVHIVRIYEQDGSNADLCRRGLLRDGAPILIRNSPGSQIAGELLPEPVVRVGQRRARLDGTAPRERPTSSLIWCA